MPSLSEDDIEREIIRVMKDRWEKVFAFTRLNFHNEIPRGNARSAEGTKQQWKIIQNGRIWDWRKTDFVVLTN